MLKFAVDFGLCVSVANGPLHHMCGSPAWMVNKYSIVFVESMSRQRWFKERHILFRYLCGSIDLTLLRSTFGVLVSLCWNYLNADRMKAPK